MPYRKKRSYKPKRRKNLPFTKKQVKAVRKIAQTSNEVKYTDESFNSTNIYAGNGLQVNLSAIPQGDGNSNREGDSVRPQSITLRAMLESSSTTPALIRCYAIQQLSGTTPTSINAISPDNFFPTMDVADEPYKVLYDRVLSVNPNGGEKKLFRIKIPYNKLKKIHYEKGTSTTSYGDIKFYFVPDASVSTGNGIEVDGNLRLRYTD